MFSEKEIAYLKSQRLARIATVSKDLQPDVVPVGFEFDGHDFFIPGLIQTKTLKYKNVRAGNTKVALVIDDIESTDPWKPRGIKIYGIAGIVDHQGQFLSGPHLRITPQRYRSWGIERPVFEPGTGSPQFNKGTVR
jgi:pyridoxamine 5'-phosphate oxidase family protein